jgi:hypothetical protein
VITEGEESVTMSGYRPDGSFLAVLARLDNREVDLIITPADYVADWAEQHGYRIVRATSPGGLPIFEIWRGDTDQLVGAGVGHGHAPVGLARSPLGLRTPQPPTKRGTKPRHSGRSRRP